MNNKNIKDNKINKRSVYSIIAMGSCFAMGNFTDNLYKQCIVLLAAKAALTDMQSIATILFSLPYILFSAWAGWLSDYLPKKNVVIASKIIELFAVILGAFMLIHSIWWGILFALFCMGFQATFFSPALNGTIPESFPSNYVARINSLIKLAATVAVLAGTGFAGLFLDLRPSSDQRLLYSFAKVFGVYDGASYGKFMVGFYAFILAVLGVIFSLTIKKIPASMDRASALRKFPKKGFIDSFTQLIDCYQRKTLFKVILAEGYFYGIAATVIISITNMTTDLGFSSSSIGLFTSTIMIGIAVGSLIIGSFKLDNWRRSTLYSGLSMAFFILCFALTPFLSNGGEPGSILSAQSFWLFFILFACGICGGMYLIPLTSLIQILPEVHEKGKIIGISNFFTFVSIAIFGVVFFIVSYLPVYLTFAAYSLFSTVFIYTTVRNS